jgi:competence protein ComFC
MRFLNTILDFIFPSKCVSCGRSGADLCHDCLLGSRAAERESQEWIFPLYDYRHPPIKKALWMFKYDSKKRLAVIFAEILFEKILEELSDLSVMENFKDPILIPIPLSPKRYRERGYNQAELICRELISLSKTNYRRQSDVLTLETKVLIKPKDTEHQARIRDRRARLKNLAGSFSVKNIELIKNRNVILIDDVTTTGATLSEARKTLKQAGARKVIAFTVAH